jgi:signal transduction histidine kinase
MPRNQIEDPTRDWTTHMVIVVSDELEAKVREMARTVWSTPFTKQTRSELLYFVAGTAIAGAGLAFVAITMAAGVVLAITFIGLAVVGLSIRGARGIGGIHRGLARRILGEEIQDPNPFSSRPGFLGWIQSVLRDRTGWRAMAYVVIKVPLSIAGVYFAVSIWWDALACLTYPFTGAFQPPVFGFVSNFFRPGYFSVGFDGPIHGFFIFFSGVILFFLAPWAVRAVVSLDRFLLHSLLGPDAVELRVRSLEQARTQTVDESAATLRRIERDLHDGTQAQLVALAMRLGMAKEKLADDETFDLEKVRELVDEAHRGAKEAIVELRDLARGIHPPALDIGLEGALSTLAARSTVPTDLAITLNFRPTQSIEAIAYFCVAELLANVAQHARASRASISCAQHGQWLRLVVRDDGVGGAEVSRLGSSSSGLNGLTDRVHAVDGQLALVSPPGGPTVVTVDLPLHA